MNTKKYNWVLYLISSTIVITIAVQLFWNYRNYQENKLRVQSEIQSSLDTAIDEYYSNLSKTNFFSKFITDTLRLPDKSDWNVRIDSTKKNVSISSIFLQKQFTEGLKKIPQTFDSIVFLERTQLERNLKRDSLKVKEEIKPITLTSSFDSLKVSRGIRSIIIALSNDDIDFKKMDSLFTNQLTKKNILTPHYISMLENSKVRGTSLFTNDSFPLFVSSKSTYLKPYQDLRAYYKDPSKAALKRSLGGISISLLLSLVIISTLFYLLKIINKQKELAEIKNDLISNITHEFKTPIATVSTALEAIKNFNAIDNKDKTQKYVAMSTDQMKKLNQMVEKLLETATLDSEKLILNKETIDLISLLDKTTNKYKLIDHNKNIHFTSNIDSIEINVDSFHMENAISNLIDNAIKYGGDTIEVSAIKLLNQFKITVADNGKGIEKNQLEKVFDKFYRVPKGNTHDVKGFGIGLYYTKKIIEKHEGIIGLKSSKQQTTFTITLPYDYKD